MWRDWSSELQPIVYKIQSNNGVSGECLWRSARGLEPDWQPITQRAFARQAVWTKGRAAWNTAARRGTKTKERVSKDRAAELLLRKGERDWQSCTGKGAAANKSEKQGYVSTESTEIKRLLEIISKWIVYVNILENLKEMNTFLDTYDLAKLNQKSIGIDLQQWHWIGNLKNKTTPYEEQTMIIWLHHSILPESSHF